MVATDPLTVITAEQLYALPDDGNRYELIEGALSMMSPAGSEHGRIAGRIFLRLASMWSNIDWVRRMRRKPVSALPDRPIRFDSPTRPSSAVSDSRPWDQRLGTFLWRRLVVEVVSPNDSFSSVAAKALEWLKAGCQIVLVADPSSSTIHVYEAGTEMRLLRSGDRFSAGSTCGGWNLDVDDAFGVSN